jgi:hypothetical protein
MLKSSSPNAPSTWLVIFFVARELILTRRACLHSASGVLAVRISCRDIAVFVFKKPSFINKTLPYLSLLNEYHVIYSVRYYPRFHVTAVGLGTYCPEIRVHTCIRTLTYNAQCYAQNPEQYIHTHTHTHYVVCHYRSQRNTPAFSSHTLHDLSPTQADV